LTGLFASKKEKQTTKELENRSRDLFTKFELTDLQKFCQNVIGKEPEPWRKKGDEYEKKGKWYQEYYQLERHEFEDFIWNHVKKNKITFEQVKNYALRHDLISKRYFEQESRIQQNNILSSNHQSDHPTFPANLNYDPMTGIVHQNKITDVQRRGWTENEKEQVRIRQNGLCNKCRKPPPAWQYHHIDGNRSNNDLNNCEGLCPNCHAVKTHYE